MLLTLLSLGPGDPQQMTQAAREALSAAEVIIGYQTYIEQVRPLLSPQQEVIARPMQSEIERAQQALDLAAAGRRVALISSGDIGMYAMAGPVFELLHQRGGESSGPEVQVLPGVSAFQAAAARVGAAINHDLCTISLSDLLTPWEVIERRLWAAAEGDFVLALYNPRSKGRHWQLARACDILRTNRPPDTPVVLARNVTRPDEQLIRTTLADIDPAQADMFTVVLVGNSQSYWSGNTLVTPRGYHQQASPGTAGPYEVTLNPTYPLNLTQMQAAPVVVLGGGLVGERKVRGLLAVGAQVTLISPDATPQLREWASAGHMTWQQRPYQSGDLADRPALVFAATSERATNAQVARDAAALGLLCNVADAPHEGSFHLPAVYREAGLVVTISTEGADPARARQVRDRLAELLQQEGAENDG
jgi:cobalt-precorrin 5A hydrolase/precorrin-3B C17-methyltransferase